MTPGESLIASLRRKGIAPLWSPEIGETPPRDLVGFATHALELPESVADAEDLLICLWAAENGAGRSPAPSVICAFSKARRKLSAPLRRHVLTLSDHDRASLARYSAPANVVLLAASIAVPRVVYSGGANARKSEFVGRRRETIDERFIYITGG